MALLPGLSLSPEFAERYRIGRVIGRGAMGVVMEGIDLRLDRPVAFKFLHHVSGPELLARFVREGKLLAAVTHPNIVQVFDLGLADRHPYLVTELLQGGTLAMRIASRGRFPPLEAVGIVAACLDGLAACHAAGIVHRDLKPANILFGRDDRPRIADLGIARVLDLEGTSLSQSGALLGTPRYMSPEQAAGTPAVPASDIYSMGLILHEMLNGKPTFESSTTVGYIRLHLDVPPPRIDPVVPGLGRALVDVVDEMLAKDPAGRPASAGALAERLRASLSPAAARPAPEPVRPGSPARRRVAIAAVLLAAVAGVAATGWHNRIPPSLASSTSPASPPVTSPTSAPTPSTTGTAPVRAPASATPPELPGGQPVVLAGHRAFAQSDLRAIAFAPDGRSLVSADEHGYYAAWSVPEGSPVASGSLAAGEVSALAFLGASRFASAAADGTLRVHEASSGRTLLEVRAHEGPVRALAALPSGPLLASAGDDGQLRVTDLERGVPAWSVRPGRVRSLAAAADGRVLAAQESRVGVWKNGRSVLELPTGARDAAFSPDGRRIITGHADGSLRQWDALTGKLIASVIAHEGPVERLAVAPDGRRVATAGDDERVVVHTAEGRKVWEADAGCEGPTALAWSPDARWVAVCGIDGSGVLLLDAGTAAPRPVRGQERRAFSGIAVSEDGVRLSVGSLDGSVRSLQPGSAPPRMLPRGVPHAVALSATGDVCAVVLEDRRVGLWRAGPGTGTTTDLFVAEAEISCVALAPDGALVATGLENAVVHVHDAAARAIASVHLPAAPTALAIAPRSRVLAIAVDEQGIMLQTVLGGPSRRVLPMDIHISALAFTPEEDILIVGSSDRRIRLVHIATGRTVRTLSGGHQGAVHGLGMPRGGRWLVSAGADGLVLRWPL